MPRFTDVYIRNLQPRETRYEVRESHGFGMRIFPSGEKSWQFVYTQLGRKRCLTLGSSYPAMTLKDARIALETWGEYLRGLITCEAMPANIVPMARSA